MSGSADARLSQGRRHRARAPRKGDLTEAAILDAAWSLLTTKPLSRITIEDIATGAGITRPTFYFYFASKADLTHALAGRIADEIRQSASAFFEPADDRPRAAIRRGVAAYMARWKEKGTVLRAMAAVGETDATLRAFWDEVTDDLFDDLARAIDEQRRAGRMLPAPPSSGDLVRALQAMLWRAGYELSLQPRSADEEERLVDTLTTVTLRALYANDDPG